MAVHGLAARIGRTAYPVRTWEQVSTAYMKVGEHLGPSISVPERQIINLLGRVVGRVGRDGRVYLVASTTPVYEPI